LGEAVDCPQDHDYIADGGGGNSSPDDADGTGGNPFPDAAGGGGNPSPEDVAEINRDSATDTFPHVRSGSAGDGVVYVDVRGRMVKLDALRRMYTVDIGGHRNTMQSPRPSDIAADVWEVMGPVFRLERQKTLKAAARVKAEAEAAKVKLEPRPPIMPAEGELVRVKMVLKKERAGTEVIETGGS
jgi:hypothetical protein